MGSSFSSAARTTSQRSARDRAVAGPGLGIDQMLGQGRRGAVRPGDVTIHVVLRPHRSADQLDEPVEHLAVDPGIEVVRLGIERLPPRPGADERLLNHPFRVDPCGQLAADPPPDHRQQPRAQPLEGGRRGSPPRSSRLAAAFAASACIISRHESHPVVLWAFSREWQPNSAKKSRRPGKFFQNVAVSIAANPSSGVDLPTMNAPLIDGGI